MTGIGLKGRNIESVINSDYVMCVDRDLRTQKITIHFSAGATGVLARKEFDCTTEKADGILKLFEGAFSEA